MKKKIYWNIFGVAVVAVIISVTLSTLFYYSKIELQMKQEVSDEVQYLESAIELSGQEYLARLSKKLEGRQQNQITLIDLNGVVLYDSYVPAEHLENYSDRPEVQDALNNGIGESTRVSGTSSDSTYYYALRLSDGSIIRCATTYQSVVATMYRLIPWVILLVFLIAILSLMISKRLTKRIIKPINELNLVEPKKEVVYEELSPLVRRIQKQNTTIQRQIDLLKEQEKEFASITEQMQEGFLIINRRQRVVSYNDSALKILGIDKNTVDLTGSNILHFNRSDEFYEAVENALQGIHSEYLMETGDRTYQMIANPVKDHQNYHGATMLILDVTEKQKREAFRKEFSANVSHELKTPLTSILGYAEMLKDGLVKAEDVNLFLDRIYLEAKRMVTLIEDIMQLSRLDEHNNQLDFVLVDLYEIVHRVIERRTEQAKNKHVSLALDGDKVTLMGVEHILEEMIDNLCDNAIKYNQDGGKVNIFVGLENDCPIIQVNDTGIGIIEADQERIFERFYRSDKSHSKMIEGTGLGLSIVKRGALCHRAQIQLESSLGTGSRIKIIFEKQTPEGS